MLLQQVAAPAQQVLAKAGDRPGQGRSREPAPLGTEHAVKGVHDDLVDVRGDLVAALARRSAACEKPREQLGQDPGLTAEAGPVGRADQGRGVAGLRRRPARTFRAPRLRARVAQRIQVKGADDRGVEAAEIQHGHVAVEPGHGLEDRAAERPAHGQGVDTPCGSHPPPLVHGFDVEVLKGGDAGPGPIEGHARELAAAQCEVVEACALEDAQDELGVAKAVQAEAAGILAASA